MKNIIYMYMYTSSNHPYYSLCLCTSGWDELWWHRVGLFWCVPVLHYLHRAFHQWNMAKEFQPCMDKINGIVILMKHVTKFRLTALLCITGIHVHVGLSKATTSGISVSDPESFQISRGQAVNQHHSLPMQAYQHRLKCYLLSLKYFHATLCIQYTNYWGCW